METEAEVKEVTLARLVWESAYHILALYGSESAIINRGLANQIMEHFVKLADES